MSLLPQLRQRAVRDLYWACFGEPLMAADCAAANYAEVCRHFPAIEQWFLALDRNPGPLHRHLAQLTSTRLGIYFESLWDYFLRYGGVAELVSKNRQVREGKQTLGEYDFIYYCRRRQCHIHLETAVKFYLGVPGYCGGGDQDLERAQAWVGPGCRDRLDVKSNALLQRQLPLSRSLNGKRALTQLGIEHVEQELAFKGILFYPGSMRMPSPQGHDARHQRGAWLHHEAFNAEETGELNWQILQRQQWFSPMLVESKAGLLSCSELQTVLDAHFDAENQAPLQVVSLRRSDTIWLENKRYFIMPNNWNGRLGPDSRV